MLPAVAEYHAVSAMLLLRIKFFQLLIITHHLPDIFIEVNPTINNEVIHLQKKQIIS